MTPDVTNVTIDFWQLLMAIAVTVVFIGTLMLAAGKMLLAQLDARLVERDQAMSTLTSKVDEVERDVLRLRADLPSNYVQRDDWIRFSGSLDTKLDWLREKQDETRQLVTRVSEQVNGLKESTDAR